MAAAEGISEERMHLCGIHRCGIYGAWPVVMGAVAVVRVGIILGHLSGHHAGHAESWHNLACICRGTRSHGTTSHARGVGMGSVERVRPDPRPPRGTDDLFVLGAHRSSLLSGLVACGEMRVECADRGDQTVVDVECRSRVDTDDVMGRPVCRYR